MRLVSKELNSAINGNASAPANFGLFFNKMLEYADDRGVLKPRVKTDNNLQNLVSQYEKSSKETKELLKHRHLQQAAYCRAMEKAGWQVLIFHAELTSPFVSGLGASHPTETGLVLDHITGVPYIPAAGQKGVTRLAHIINSLQDDDGNDRDIDELIEKKLVSRGKDEELIWHEDEDSKTLFGFSEKSKSLAGQVVTLDAYPLSPPELGEEILNPHYPDYYKGNRGPTEDQSPIPIKFLAVKKAEFVFRVLLRLPLAEAPSRDMEQLADILKKNIRRAIEDEGFGAKTALGFGRFKIKAAREPETVEKWLRDKTMDESPWLLILERISSVQDWGQLRQQVLDNAEAGKWQSRRDVAGAVLNVAERIRQKAGKKWKPERDEQIAAWLNPAGVEWVCLESAEPEDVAVGDASPLLAKIMVYADWGAFKSDPVDISTIDKPCILALQKKLKGWGCSEKRAKKDKRQAWKNLQNRLRQLK